MKLREIFRFELLYQIRRPLPWLSFVILAVFAFENTRVGIMPVTLPKDFILNSPFIITAVSVISCLIWLLMAPAIAGEAAARDVQTAMHPLTYTSPVTKTEYLGGRFLAAFILNALILLGVQVGSLLAAYAPGIDPEIIGPFRPAAYLRAYAFIALPNAFIATTIQFWVALKSGRSLVSYLGSGLVFFFTIPVPFLVYFGLGQPALAKLMDPIGMLAIMNEMMSNWTIVEKNVRMFTLEGPMLLNRILWFFIALTSLAFIHRRFRFAHRTTTGVWTIVTRRFKSKRAVPDAASSARVAFFVPQARRSFGFATSMRQTLAIARSSFRMIVTSPAGLFLLIVFPMFVLLVVRTEMEHWGVTLLPRTGYVLTKHVMASLLFASDYRVMVPLLVIYFSGELIWRERDAMVSENVDATPVREWVLLLGKLSGLVMVLVALMAMLTLVVMMAHVIMSYYDFQIGLSLKLLFGLQLPEYLLFAVLVFTIQAVVNQKHLGMVVSLVAYIGIVFSSVLGIEHHLLVYGASADWFFTGMRGLGKSVGPWLWFKFYWAAWALLLAVTARLLWVRGREPGLAMRLRIARVRFTRATASVAAISAGLILTLGGFIFYNTNVVNEYRTDAESIKQSAQYERQYGKYERLAQPEREGIKLQIEIYPDNGSAVIRGSYRLVNRNSIAIDSVHLEPASFVETQMTFDRPVTRVLADDDLDHFIYALNKPLQPGDSLALKFNVKYKPRGFRNRGASRAIVPNGTYFTSAALPAVGYQSRRELTSPDDRRAQHLPRKVTLPTPDDVDPNIVQGSGATFDAIIGTDKDQIAIAPGELRRTWVNGERRYFHYASDVPLQGLFTFFSADYTLHQERWNDVEIQSYVHPRDTAIVDRMLGSARAALDYYSTEFGPYPYRFLQIVEQPSNGMGMGVDGSGVVTGLEGFYLLRPKGNGPDAVFEIVAHEMAHQWWGGQLKYAFAEGAVVLSESLAWYSGMQLVKKTKGREHLRQFMSFMREPNPWPPIRTGLPLLRAMDPYAGYRKGPFAMYALSEYVGTDRVNGALKTLLEKQTTSGSLATTLDLYHELQTSTPDSLKPLLHDLFEVNTFWKFDTKKATAKQTAPGKWEVTFDVDAHKVVADSAGPETETPMRESVEIGIFAAAGAGEILGKPLYLEKHRIRSGAQTITVTVSEKPARGGIDPYNLLDWEEGDNIEKIELEGST